MKKMVFLLVLLSLSTSSSQVEIEAQAETFFVSIIVQNIQQSANWYTEILKFQTIDELENTDSGFKITNMNAHGIMLELIEISGSASPDQIRSKLSEIKRIQGIFKFGLFFQDFEAWISHFNSQQINSENLEVTRPGTNKRMLVLKDPDGNRVQIFEN